MRMSCLSWIPCQYGRRQTWLCPVGSVRSSSYAWQLWNSVSQPQPFCQSGPCSLEVELQNLRTLTRRHLINVEDSRSYCSKPLRKIASPCDSTMWQSLPINSCCLTVAMSCFPNAFREFLLFPSRLLSIRLMRWVRQGSPGGLSTEVVTRSPDRYRIRAGLQEVPPSVIPVFKKGSSFSFLSLTPAVPSSL